MRNTSPRRRKTNPATLVTMGRATRRAVMPPTPPEGYASCPVCRAPAKVLTYGHLRRHNDLFGHPCYNREPPE